MKLTVTKNNNGNDKISKKDFEKAYIELMESVRMIDQKLSTKADEVVLTMTLAHRQEIEDLQMELLTLQKEVKSLKRREKNNESNNRTFSRTFNQEIPLLNWFKRMQLSRK